MVIKSSLASILFWGILISCCSICSGDEIPDNRYLGQEPPGMNPVIFARDIISIRNRYEDGISFTPDGLECCIAVTDAGWMACNLYYTQQVNGQWSTPSRAYFQGGSDGWTCQFGPDSLCFYFISTRTAYQPDVWMCERSNTTAKWSFPSRIPTPVSPTNEREWAPSVTLDRTLYFTTPRSGGYGANDIWRSRYINGRYETVEKIGPPVNTSAGEQSAFIAPDESYLIFTTSGRPDTFGSSDLYISYRFEDDSWTIPVNLGPMINTEHEERCPYVSFDGEYLFFTRRSDTDADVYWVNTAAFLPDPNGPIENLTTGERFGSIQQAIYYANNGDEIVLAPGIYQERFNFMNKDLIICSLESNPNLMAMDTTVIQSQMDEPVVVLNGNSKLEGLTIVAGGTGILAEGASPSILGCRIEQNQGDGIQVAGGTYLTIKNSIVADNDRAGISLLSTMGRNKIYGNCSVINCTIVNNSGFSISGQGQASIITNSIIYFNSSSRNNIQIESDLIEISYSDIQGGRETDSNNNIDLDPLFADPDNGDYHLQSGSPCIDAGDPISEFSSEPEPNGARINIGAYGGTSQAGKSL